jgi:hypothetical protein
MDVGRSAVDSGGEDRPGNDLPSLWVRNRASSHPLACAAFARAYAEFSARHFSGRKRAAPSATQAFQRRRACLQRLPAIATRLTHGIRRG